MSRLILIRHGQTEWNEGGRYQGHTNTRLSPAGKEQARRLQERFRPVELQAVCSSDLDRARQTAEIIAKPHGLEVMTFPELRELNFGRWEGLTYKEIKLNYADLSTSWFQNPGSLQLPDGEAFQAMQGRAWKAVCQIVERIGPEENATMVAVSHGGTIRAIICSVLGLPLSKVWNIRQDNTAVNIIDFYQGRAVLALLNDTHHLFNSSVS